MSSQPIDARAVAAGGLAVAVLTLALALGSRGFVHFDASLLGYAIGSALAAFAVGYRFAVWAQRPPSRMYFKRGLQLMFRRPPHAVLEKLCHRRRLLRSLHPRGVRAPRLQD